MKVALLGGSFDPLHLGHLLLAAELLWRYEPEALWLLPVARHAFEKVLSPFEDRLAMADIGARLLGPRVEALATEQELVERGGDGATVSLLRHLTAVHRNAEFLLALGADAYAQRERWTDFASVTQLAQVVVFNRTGVAAVAGGGPHLPAIASSDIRTRIKDGTTIEELVPLQVRRYIQGRGLYR